MVSSSPLPSPGPFRSWWSSLSLPLKLAAGGLVVLLASNGLLGTINSLDILLSQARSKATEAQIVASDARIKQLEAEVQERDRAIDEREKQRALLLVAIEAKQELIDQAGTRLKQSDQRIEEIVNEAKAESDRIDTLSAEDVERELRAKLKAAGRLK